MKKATIFMALAILSQGTYVQRIRAAENGEVAREIEKQSLDLSRVYSEDSNWEEDVLFWLGTAKLPGGILLDGIYLEKKSVQVETGFRTISFRELLARVCQDNPGYEWKIERGVINILPRDMQKQHLRAFETVVSTFSVYAPTPQRAIYDLLKKFKVPVKLAASMGGPSGSTKPVRNFRCQRLSIFGCMNQFVKQDGDGFWYMRYDRKSRRFELEASEHGAFRDVQKK